jgi:hypothetical protein
MPLSFRALDENNVDGVTEFTLQALLRLPQ